MPNKSSHHQIFQQLLLAIKRDEGKNFLSEFQKALSSAEDWGPNSTDRKGNTIMHYFLSSFDLSKNSSAEIFEILLQNGCSLTINNKENINCLWTISQLENAIFLRIALQHGYHLSQLHHPGNKNPSSLQAPSSNFDLSVWHSLVNKPVMNQYLSPPHKDHLSVIAPSFTMNHKHQIPLQDYEIGFIQKHKLILNQERKEIFDGERRLQEEQFVHQEIDKFSKTLFTGIFLVSDHSELKQLLEEKLLDQSNKNLNNISSREFLALLDELEHNPEYKTIVANFKSELLEIPFIKASIEGSIGKKQYPISAYELPDSLRLQFDTEMGNLNKILAQMDYIEDTKILGHKLGLIGDFNVQTQSSSTRVRMGRYYEQKTVPELANAVDDFISHDLIHYFSEEKTSATQQNTITGLLTQARNNYDSIVKGHVNENGFGALYENYKNGQPVFIPVTEEGHFTMALLVKNKLYFCDRGSYFNAGIHVFDIQSPENLSREMIIALASQVRKSSISFKDDPVLASLNLKENKNEFIPMKGQEAENCGYTNLKIATYALLVAHNKENPDNQVDVERIYKSFAFADRKRAIDNYISKYASRNGEQNVFNENWMDPLLLILKQKNDILKSKDVEIGRHIVASLNALGFSNDAIITRLNTLDSKKVMVETLGKPFRQIQQEKGSARRAKAITTLMSTTTKRNDFIELITIPSAVEKRSHFTRNIDRKSAFSNAMTNSYTQKSSVSSTRFSEQNTDADSSPEPENPKQKPNL